MSFFEFPHTRTYDSDLGWLIKTVSNIGNEYEELVEYMNQHKIEYAELVTRVETLENEIDTFESEIDIRFTDLQTQLYTDVDNKIAAVIAEVRTAIAGIDLALENIKNEFNQFKTETTNLVLKYYYLGKDYTDFKIQELINSLPELTTVYVFNPIKGHITTLQVAINDLYDLGRPYGITAKEYDELLLTAAEYDALEITALEYDLYATKFLEEAGLIKNKWHYMYDPFTGDYVPLQTVISELADLHKENPITAAEYDALEITAGDYDGREITAQDYDFRAKTILV